jgi:ribose transport system substrate-binding protein
MRRQSRALPFCALCLAVGMAALVLSACGSSSDSSSSSSAENSTAAETTTGGEETGGTAPSSYEGVDSELPSSFPKPEEKAGTSFKVGFLQIIGAIPVLATEQAGVEKEVANFGGEVIVKDAELDLQKQAAGFEQLLSQGVDAIVVYPVVPKTLLPQLEKAKAAGIPVISTDARPDPTKPLPKGYVADVEQSLDYEAYELTKALSEKEPGASFAIMGLAAPVEALQYLAARQQYWGEQFGLKYEGLVDAKQDQPAAYAAAATAILGKYPDVQAIMTYNDLAALSTYTAARTAGKELLITGAQGGDEAAVEAIAAGTLFATYSPPWEETGAEMVRGAYSEVTEQNLPLPETVTLKGTLVTQENADEFEPISGG